MKAKDFIISELERADGAFVSGEELAKKLSLTRQSVWKAICALKADGYDILCVPNRGYALSADCDRLSSAVLRNLTGMNAEVYGEVASTNSLARLRYAQAGECAIAAASQTDGQTKDGDNFPSPQDRGVYVSCAFDVWFAAERREEFTEACESAISDLIGRYTDGRAERQGNRIYTDGRQACGILAEGQLNLNSDIITSVVVGVGVYTASVDDELGCIECGERRNALIADICNALKDAVKPFKKC